MDFPILCVIYLTSVIAATVRAKSTKNMKQLIQNLKTGDTLLEDVPVPCVQEGSLLIKTTHSLVSLGTERMLVEFGKAGFLEKARQQPDKVKQVLDKLKTDGISPTLTAVFNKLRQPLPLGYCNVGIIDQVGDGVLGFKAEDRVVSNGPHAEYVCVPQNLTAKIPDNVSDEQAAFTIVGAIALEGMRLSHPTFGETFVVVGLGLIGLVAAALLKSNGCRVIGYDFDNLKIEKALQIGIIAFNAADGNDPVKFVHEATKGIGADGVIITASSKEHDIIHSAAEMSRKRGRIVLVGVIGLNIRRSDFYEKELTFQVSCSYGPGRYDDNYEQKGLDYPVGFVRWTEKRNFEAILNAISLSQLDFTPLITERVIFKHYHEIYGNMRKPGSVASILVFPGDTKILKNVSLRNDLVFKGKKGVFGIIGAGNYAASTLIPGLQAANATIKCIASLKGLSAKVQARRAGISEVTSDYRDIMNDHDIDSVVIATRHNLHAGMVIESLKAGKNVFVEKPLCLSQKELEGIIAAHAEFPESLVFVGFNRRFSPLAAKMKKLLGAGPVNIIATMNAGFIPSNSWVHDLSVGGGE